jgi:hypothetical protein
MDPASIAGSVIGTVATGAASKAVDTTQKKWGMKAVATQILIVVAVLALYQVYKTGHWRGVTG